MDGERLLLLVGFVSLALFWQSSRPRGKPDKSKPSVPKASATRLSAIPTNAGLWTSAQDWDINYRDALINYRRACFVYLRTRGSPSFHIHSALQLFGGRSFVTMPIIYS